MRVRTIVGAALASSACALVAAGPANAALSVVPSPNAFAGNNDLNGVGASSSSDAWAVGTLCCSVRHSGIGTLTQHFDGRAWSVVPSPDTLFNDDALNAVADLSPSNAWAVGNVKQSGFKSGSPLIVHWNGTSWQTVSPPAGVTGTLRAVSADGPSDVWAVGNDIQGHATALRFNGTTWSATTLPSVGVDNLQGVKAFGPNDVWAVGSRLAAGSTQGLTLVAHWNGSAWSIVASPSPDPNTNSLHAIDGRSSTDLWAVGEQARDESQTGVGPGTRALAEHWNGTRWTVAATPNTGDQDSLNGVAALTPTAVLSAGTFEDRSGPIPIDRTLAERWNGTSWVTQASGNVGSTDNLLTGAAAIPGTTAAWAVGFHLTASGPDQTLIEQGG